MSGEHPTPSAGTFAWLAAGMMAFTVYGSLVPFHLRDRSFDDAVQGFRWVIEHRSNIQSRSDFAANFLLGVPLGFCLLAALRLDKPRDAVRSVFAMLLVWPWCVAFAAAVEFAQLFFQERTCSGSDIIAQGLGSLVGMLAWMAFGDSFVRRFRRVWQGDRIGGTAGRILVAYLAVLALAMWLPLDLTLSPAELYHKNLDGKTKAVLVPFAEVTQPGGPAPNLKLIAWLQLAGLFLIAGLLAAGIHRSPWKDWQGFGGVLLRGLLLMLLMEAGQLFVVSRTASATDVLIGTASVCIGWALVRTLRPAPGQGLSRDLGLLLLQSWIALLMAIHWLPFHFDASLFRSKLAAVNWIPFAAEYEHNYLNSLEEAVTKTLLYAPLGAVVAATGVRRVKRRRDALLLGVAIAAILELGQLMLPTRVAGPTDLIFGGVGAWLGASAALRLRAFGFGAYQPPPPRNPVRFKVT